MIQNRNKTQIQASEEIKSYAALRAGWDFGQGVVFSSDVINRSLSALLIICTNQINTRAFPNTDGTITISFFHGDNFCDLKIGKGDLFELTHERGIGQNFEEICFCELNFIDSFLYIRHHIGRDQECISHEYSIQGIITPKKIGFNPGRLHQHQVIIASPSFQLNVLPMDQQRVASATTSNYSMRRSRESHLYTGSSPALDYQVVYA